MNTINDLIGTVRLQLDAWGIGWTTVLAVALAGLLVLFLVAALLRRLGRGDAAQKVTTFATVLGLGWSAQGMWDTAVHHYDQGVVVASILFIVFEAWLAGRMLRAYQYRRDYARRGKFVTAVWTGACVMAIVVATGEGWQQAPGRLAIPLLVAYGWYTDLTAADDPGERPKTSWRWTPRRALLALGALEPGARDAQTIDRDRLRDRLTRLSFRMKYATPASNNALRRPVRLAKLKTLADDADLAEVRIRLARMSVDLMAEAEQPEAPQQPAPEVHPVAPPQPKPKEVVKPAKPADPERLVQGVHLIGGRALRGPELHDELIRLVVESAGPGKPNGMSNEELATLTTPALKQRTAEKIGAEARRRLRAGQINGNAPEGVALPL